MLEQITHFTQLFKYSSGIIAMWGVFAISSILPVIKQQHPQIAKANICCCVTIAFITACILWVMFISPSIATANMFAIFSLEFWYSIFAIYYTNSQIIPTLNQKTVNY